MARRALLQMDQTAPSDQGILRNDGECGKDPGMDRYFRLCPRGHREKALEAGPEPLHNSTDSERHPFRENAHFTGFLSHGIRKSGERCG